MASGNVMLTPVGEDPPMQALVERTGELSVAPLQISALVASNGTATLAAVPAGTYKLSWQARGLFPAERPPPPKSAAERIFMKW